MFAGSSFSSWDRDCASAPLHGIATAIATAHSSLRVMRTLIELPTPKKPGVSRPCCLEVGSWELAARRSASGGFEQLARGALAGFDGAVHVPLPLRARVLA